MDDLEKTETSNETNSLEISSPGPAIKYGWLRAFLFLIAAAISYTIFSAIGFIIVLLVSGSDMSLLSSNPAEVINNIGSDYFLILNLFGLLGMLLMVWIFRRFIDRQSLLSLGFAFSEYKKDLLAGMAWGAGLITAGFFALYFAGYLTITGYQFDIFSLLKLALLFIIVSLNEEIMVRGYILPNLMDSMNKYIALVVSSLLFFAMHLGNPNMAGLPGFNIFLAGIVLGVYYIYKRNLWFPIGMHFAWNFFQGPVFGFEVSGKEAQGIIIQEINGPGWITGEEFGFEGSALATIFVIGIIVFLHLKYRDKK